MKSIIKILVLFPLLSVSLNVQFSLPQPYQQTKENFSQSSKDSTSLMVEQLVQRGGNNNWYNLTKTSNSYNSKGQIELVTNYDWQNGDWYPTVKSFYQYNDLSQLVRKYTIQSRFNWNIFSDVSYRYNETGKEIESVIKSISQNGIDYYYAKVLTEYDSLNNARSVVTQKFENNVWVNIYNTSYHYDKYNNMIEQLSQSWRGNAWGNEQGYRFAYDNNRNRTKIIFLVWRNTAWDSLDMHIYNFNSQNQLLNQNTFVKQNDIWIKDSKFEYAYDSKGNWIFQMFQYWADSVLVNGNLNFYEYDQNGKLSQEVEKGWRGNNWEYNGKVTYDHDSKGNLTNKTYYKWAGEDWVYVTHYLFKYEEPTNVQQILTLPKQFELFNNYPNPFNSSTVIGYKIPIQGVVTIKVFDVLGKEITTLVNELKPPGKYEVNFDANQLSSGVYFYAMSIDQYYNVKKLVLVK